MTTFSNRGKAIYKDVLQLEQSIFTDKNADKKLKSIELRLQSIRIDFERQAKTLLEKIPSNMRGRQNVINTRSKKVKKVKVADMNAALKQMKNIRTGPASESPITSTAGAQKLESAFEKLDERLKTVGSRFQN